MVNVLMHGCNGRMGQMISQMIKNEDELQIVAGVDSYTQVLNSYPVYASILDVQESVDVIIDFSTASAMKDLMMYCQEKKTPVVLCTTGLSEEQVTEIEQLSQVVPVLKSANMSLGVNVLFKLVQEAARSLANAGFDIEIVEKHHNQKIDAPSGTALAIADAINEAMEHKYQYIFDRSSTREKRAENELGISAVRGGSIVGEHDVIYAGLDEVIEIRHTAYSRSIFANGAISAARFLVGQTPRMYDMSDVI